ncbi:hypothetical protein [Bacillus sp. EB106-08-02-XG196]
MIGFASLIVAILTFGQKK